MKPFDPRLLRVVPQARRPVLLLGAVGVAAGVATVGTVFALAALVTTVVHGGELAGPALALAATFAVRAGLGWLTERTAARSGVAVSAALRRMLVATWLARPEERRPDPAHASTLAAQGCTSVETYVAKFLPALIHAATVPALAVLAMVFVDWRSALVVALTLPLLPLFAALIGRSTQEATQRRWAALTALSGHFLDVVQGLPTLVAYGRGERQVETVRRTSGDHRTETMTTLRIAFLSSAALELLATISVALVAVLVGIRLASGGMSLQPALLAILLAPEAYWPIRRVGAEFHSAADGVEALDEILDELDQPETRAPVVPGTKAPITDTPSAEALATPGSARLDHVTYTFPGSTAPVLRDVSLHADTGLTVITGPSGAGKSTALEVLAGLRTVDSGEVCSPPAHLVTQRPFLLPGSVRANLLLGQENDVNPAALWSALRLVGLDGVVAGMAAGLDTPIGDDGFGLSAGQRARLALARASLSTRPVVLLDEPTAHLDSGATAAMHDAITALARDRVVVVVSHRPELVALADQVVTLPARSPRQPHPEQVRS